MHPTLTSLSLLALVAHQIFRRYETYSVRAHLVLLLAPPALASSFLTDCYPLIYALFLAYTTYLGSLAAFVVLYRISPFHPLARYPGPVWCRISQWYMAYISLSGYEYLYIAELHQKYGDVVRTGPNELSIRDPSVVTPVMALPKGPQYYGRMLSDGTNLPLIGLQDPEEHLRRRRPWNRAFSALALKDFEESIAERVRQLIDALEREVDAGKVVVLGKWFNYFAYDLMCDMAFGGGSELLQGGEGGTVWKILDEGMVIGSMLAHLPWLGVYLSHFPLATGPLQTLIAYGRTLTEQRIERGTTRKDLFHYLNNEDLSNANSSVQKVPMRQLTDDGILVVVAGSDTTSGALTSLFYSLLKHPETYRRLQEEVDRFYPAGENALSTKHHRDMHYLNAVINETLRLFTSVPGGSQRQVLHGTPGTLVGKTYLPPGTSVSVHAHSVQHDPRNFFPHPDDFWPDRWLIAASLSSRSPNSQDSHIQAPPGFVHNEDAFIPFATGAMNCVGKNLALQEIRMVVCALMQRFEMRFREEWDPREYERELRAYLVLTRPEMPVRMKVRSGAKTGVKA